MQQPDLGKDLAEHFPSKKVLNKFLEVTTTHPPIIASCLFLLIDLKTIVSQPLTPLITNTKIIATSSKFEAF